MKRKVSQAEQLLGDISQHLFRAEYGLEQLAKMRIETLAMELPGSPVTDREYAEAKSVVVFVSEVLKSGLMHESLHALALHADKLRREHGEIEHLPGKGDVVRELKDLAASWFCECGPRVESRNDARLPVLIGLAAKGIALELARKYARIFGIPDGLGYAEILAAAERAAENFAQRVFAVSVLTGAGKAAEKLRALLVLECLVELGLPRRTAWNKLGAVSAEMARGGLKRKARR